MRRWFFLAAYLTAVVLAALYWSTDLLSHDRNRVENELAQNGLSSFVRAAGRTSEIDYHANYRSGEFAGKLRAGRQRTRPRRRQADTPVRRAP